MGGRLLRRAATVVVVVSTSLLGLPPVAAHAAATASSPITYVYDEIGRLEAVVDPGAATNGVAKYSYDDVGNLTAITRSSAASISIIDFHGNRGPVGTPVTIYGTAFNTTPSQNQVRFGGSGGTIATVTAATTTTLKVTVPSGAASGTIFVKNLGTNKSVTSTKTYAVVGSLTPTITGMNPQAADPGATVTLTGTNFDTAGAAWNNVFFDSVRAQVTGSPTATSMTVKVPPFVGGGKVSVQTTEGEGTSSADFVGPPMGFAAVNIGSTSRLMLGPTVDPAGLDRRQVRRRTVRRDGGAARLREHHIRDDLGLLRCRHLR